MFEEFGINAGFVEEMHHRFRESPGAVEEMWRSYFGELDSGSSQNGTNGSLGSRNGNGHSPSVEMRGPETGTSAASPSEQLLAQAAVQGRVYQLVNAYRVRGHNYADIDPLGMDRELPSHELELSAFQLSDADLDKTFPTVGLSGLNERATLREIVAHLQATYCSSIGVEFTHIEELEMRTWLQERMELTQNRASLQKEQLIRILTKLTDAEIFELFIHNRFERGTKRFSVEGGESMIALLDLLIDEAGARGVKEMVLGMAHRGRLNVLCNIMGKHPREIFAAFDDKHPERFLGAGDVKYHLGYSSDRTTRSGNVVHLSLCFNPSHLEWVNPVVEGRVRAKQDRTKKNVMPLLIHGDAAFIGQGVVAETLNMGGLEGYNTDGTIHVVVNNQIGFTTMPKDARSTRYCTDIARIIKVPVFHVNGEDPEAVIQVANLAVEFRERFKKDVVIDILCYRKHGHNEGDEPRYTQPLMYALIDKKPTVRQMYVKRLVETGIATQEQCDKIAEERKQALEEALEDARKGDYNKPPNSLEGLWQNFYGGPDAKIPDVPTGVEKTKLLALLEKATSCPSGFNINPKIQDLIFKTARDKANKNNTVVWGTAEILAYASLLADGTPIRLTGQDCRRGTFSHRHAVLYDTKSGESFAPLSEIGNFEVFDSPLSEAGVLGFEYGYSLDYPDRLVIWEAQFGDFLNTAQVIVDQFLVSAEDKWKRLSGLVLFLPHGYEGQGPEHSSARIERFLQMCAEDNIQVCNLTTPAQVFHVLRRQALRPWRKPLVIFTPKSLLRHPEAVSSVDDLATGSFQRVIGDATVDPQTAKKVLLCSGKVYYDLVKARREAGRNDIAILRLEQMYPLNESIQEALRPYASGTPLVWVQEEPKNMGPWYFMNACLLDKIGDRLPLSCVSRAASASPATGSKAAHDLEQRQLLAEALK